MERDSSETSEFERVRDYLSLEVPDFLEDEVKDVKLVGSFEFDFRDTNPSVNVYEVSLESGKSVFAAAGGWGNGLINVYEFQIPDAESAAKVHLYMIILHSELEDNPQLLATHRLKSVAISRWGAKGFADLLANQIGLSPALSEASRNALVF